LRSALDLLGQVVHPDPKLIYDIGTGRGDMARLMAERWPDARIVATDTSEEMLAAAAEVTGRIDWVKEDVRDWSPQAPPDVIYSNAVLHWVADHDTLFPKLAKSLAVGGVFAVQMPLSWHEPSHRLMRETLAAHSLGTDSMREELEHPPVADPAAYYRMLSPLFEQVNVWTTRYVQPLDGLNPVFEWVSGTALRPILEGLEDDDRALFVERYKTELRTAYPAGEDGITLFPFPRLFMVGTRRLVP
jgi:trans-aconitate 2-methyltransferase